MKMRHICLALCASLALSACSGGTEKASSQSSTLSEVANVIVAGRKAKRNPPELPTLTRPLLDNLTVGSLEVIASKRAQTAYLIPEARRSGNLTVWRTGGNSQVILRDGVLIGTKGLGNDLASADASPALAAVRSRGSSAGQRVMYIRNDVNGVDRMSLSCEVHNLGAENLEIVERSFPTVHLREDCSNETGKIANHYWVDRRDGTVWKSRQWAGPQTGYLDIRLLKK
ncbi:YjbF family lipoprotein [Sulfitobacter pseudonitzschiae]|uniref:YjbF family lipoprotein n=1 Tax=Pseudosulfitobacter pseudonitzschiae TaxID=1402135 RepID=A0A9Q2NIJ8_9RHOB|nr:YjbF family lipoprotein [Pseudosulfitobacter pseudonitzschiae]MBM2290768.1 YjbF family lipoprotein [Pseudosulfitobacter pseudonitzschiae]MBM2295686.1 YjbF family lipoprotein [Pseudosulfitobacter pseudonitzschiae]MBM2300598.1 YjbF family lipoprotein [Pseudosulfitobacter pseudonitzschiae]MBM2310383.1 YjbF family lipoprotein [Pseudosulfitobacter pseudonitzschiae]MBM2315295.1 YjbF family lipoprotein [Pseudosulfitobacter pseudonitzschiae]